MPSKIIQAVRDSVFNEAQYDYLKQFCIFEGLSLMQLKQVNNLINRRDFKTGECLFEEGYPMEALYFVESGEIELVSKLGGAPQKLSSGAILGMIDAQLEGGRRSTAKALSNSVTYSISISDLNYLIDHNPVLGIKLLRATNKYFSQTILRCLSH